METVWRYECTFTADRKNVGEPHDAQAIKLFKSYLEDLVNAPKVPWIVINHLAPELAEAQTQVYQHAESIVTDNILSWEEIDSTAIDELNNLETYEGIEPFDKLYGLDGQIRMLLNTIYQAVRTGGRAKSHIVLYGAPGCGKTTITEIIERLVTPEAVLKIDATKTTRAGLENLVFNELESFPPIVLLEEAENQILMIWQFG